MRYKYYVKIFKWFSTLAVLVFNIALLGGDKTFQIQFGIIVNCLAALVFTLFCFFPRKYYFISKEGISYQKFNGKEIWFLSWKNIKRIDYVGVGLIPIAAEVEYAVLGEMGIKAIHISYKQYKEVIETFKLKSKLSV